ncbi:hypothetical protein PJI74_01335 [Mycobacterium kansasii]
MSPAPDDPDFSSVDGLPEQGTGAKLPTVLDGLGAAIKATTVDVSTSTKGRTPEAVAAAAAAVAQAARTMATNAAIAEAAAKILKDAKAQWSKSWQDGGAPKKKDLDEAEKAVTEARAAVAAAQKAEDSARDAYNAASPGELDRSQASAAIAAKKKLDEAVAATKAAQEELDKAVAHKADLDAKRKTADEAYEAAWARAAEKLKELKPVEGMTPQTGGNGKGVPGQTTGGGTGTDTGGGKGSTAPGKSTGTPGSTPGAAKPGTAAPSATTPETTTSSSTGDPATTAAVASLLGKGQQQSQAQMPTMPTMPQVQATQPQQQAKQDGKSDLERQAEKNGTDALAEAGLSGLVAPSVLGGGSTAPSAPSAPAGNGITTQYRGAGFNAAAAGANLGGGQTVNQQTIPPTTGTSRTDLVTAQGNSEVGGRPVGTENKPFTAAPDGTQTRTSADHAGQGQGTAQQGRAATGAPMGAPMTPMMGGVGASTAGGSPKSGQERTRIEMYPDQEQFHLHGQDTVSEATPGGTIAQNRPNRDDPRRPGRAA